VHEGSLRRRRAWARKALLDKVVREELDLLQQALNAVPA
jgi:hypothetical protein